MSVTSQDRLVQSYLKRLRASARSLPRGERTELVQQIEEHLFDAVPADANQAEVRNALEMLGDPDEIVAEEYERLGLTRPRAGKLEWITVCVLPIGAFVIPVLGWFVGVVLLWGSRVWTTRDKLIGTFLPPGGLSAVLVFLLVAVGSSSSSVCWYGGPVGHPVEHCSSSGGGGSIVVGTLLIAFVLAGIGTPIYLARRASASRA